MELYMNKKFDLTSEWYIATDENNEGKHSGWENAIKAEAKKA
jgi:hypothetical protein